MATRVISLDLKGHRLPRIERLWEANELDGVTARERRLAEQIKAQVVHEARLRDERRRRAAAGRGAPGRGAPVRARRLEWRVTRPLKQCDSARVCAEARATHRYRIRAVRAVLERAAHGVGVAQPHLNERAAP